MYIFSQAETQASASPQWKTGSTGCNCDMHILICCVSIISFCNERELTLMKAKKKYVGG